jgi:hypothetical protein
MELAARLIRGPDVVRQLDEEAMSATRAESG